VFHSFPTIWLQKIETKKLVKLVQPVTASNSSSQQPTKKLLKLAYQDSCQSPYSQQLPLVFQNDQHGL
jgi:hypothetical protein